MEFVEGVRIDRWCDEQSLSVAQRLELFRKVCDAVQHAHQRLVVHRDLKPTNILVTADGTPKLLDFGIAKVLDPEKQASHGEGTQEVMRFFTPSYASPEQVRGLGVTTASDVYSLGVLLYQLLTGRLPHRAKATSSLEFARVLSEVEPEKPSVAVRRPVEEPAGESERPTTSSSDAGRRRSATARQLARSLAGDLDRIVMKALRPEPLRRYPTVHELSEDLRRCLAGLPISARPDSPLYRSSRFVRRNRLAVGLAALLLLSLCSGFLALLRQYRRTELARTDELAQRRLAEGRAAELERLYSELQQRSANLERQRELLAESVEQGQLLAADLEQARALAERRFNDVRRFTTSSLTDVLAKVYGLEGATEASALLLRTGLDYLGRLAEESAGDPDLQRDLARAYANLADIQAGAYQANMGEHAAGAMSIEKAAELAQGLLVDGSPASNEDRLLLGSIHITRGDFARRGGRAEDALGDYEAAVEYLTPLEELAQPTAQGLNLLSAAESRVGEWLHDKGILEEALARYQRSLEVLRRLAAERPGFELTDSNISILSGKLATILSDQGRFDEAIAQARRSLEEAEAALQRSPQNAFAKRQGLNARFLLAHILEQAGSIEEARELFAAALALARRAAEAGPRNDQAARDLVNTAIHAAGIEKKAQRWEAARALLEEALPLAKARVERLPTDWISRIELAQAQLELGRCRGKLGNWFEAGSDLGRVGETLDELWEPDGANPLQCRTYAQTSHELGSLLLELVAAEVGAVDRPRTLAAARKWLKRSELLFGRIVEEGGGLKFDQDHLRRSRQCLERIGAIDSSSPADQ